MYAKYLDPLVKKHLKEPVAAQIMREEKADLEGLLMSCNEATSNQVELIGPNFNSVRVLIHYDVHEAEVPPKQVSFYFEIEPGFVFPPHVTLQGRSAHLQELLDHQ